MVQIKSLNFERKHLWFGYECACLALFALSLNMLYEVWKSGKLFTFMASTLQVSDFIPYYAAALVANQSIHDKVSLYDPALLMTYTNTAIQPFVMRAPFVLQYPPIFFLYCIPLGLLKLAQAWSLWCGAGVAFIAASVLLITRSKIESLCLFITIMSTAWTWYSWRLGQSSFVLLFSTCLFWYLMKNKRMLAAGIAIPFLMVKLQYAPFFVLPGIILGRKDFVLGGLSGTVLMVAISSIAFSFENTINFFRGLFVGEYMMNPYYLMENFRGLLITYFDVSDGHLSLKLAAGLMTASLILIAWLWISVYPRLQKTDSKAFEYCAALTTIGALVASVHTFIPDYLLFTPACYWFYCWASQKNSTLAKAFCVFLLTLPFLSWILLVILLPMSFDHRPKPFAILAITVLSLSILVARRKTSTQNDVTENLIANDIH